MTNKRLRKLARAFLSRSGIMTKAVDRNLKKFKAPAPATNAKIWEAISTPFNFGVGNKENHQ